VRRSLQHRNAFAACIAAALLAAPAAALAQGGVRDYGSRPIRLIVPVREGVLKLCKRFEIVVIRNDSDPYDTA